MSFLKQGNRYLCMIPYGYPLLARKCHSLNSLIPTEKTAITSATITCRANWEGEAHCDTETSAVSEVIPLLVQAHYISIKDVSGMLLILKLFFLFIFFPRSARVKLCQCSDGWPQDSSRPVAKLQCPGRQTIQRFEGHFQNYAVIWWSLSTFFSMKE